MSDVKTIKNEDLLVLYKKTNDYISELEKVKAEVLEQDQKDDK